MVTFAVSQVACSGERLSTTDTRGSIAALLSRAPLSWRVLAPPAEYRYELMAGFVGVSQEPVSGALRAEIGWAVRELV